MVVPLPHFPAMAAFESNGGSFAMPPAASRLDPEAIARLRELDPSGKAGLLGRVFETYIGSADRLTEQLREARASGDAAGIRMVAHTLKSSSASVGAMDLAKACADTESIARDLGAGLQLDAAVSDLVRLLGETLQALREMQRTLDR
jgi:histidine phosphotransfer protein HptB